MRMAGGSFMILLCTIIDQEERSAKQLEKTVLLFRWTEVRGWNDSIRTGLFFYRIKTGVFIQSDQIECLGSFAISLRKSSFRRRGNWSKAKCRFSTEILQNLRCSLRANSAFQLISRWISAMIPHLISNLWESRTDKDRTLKLSHLGW